MLSAATAWEKGEAIACIGPGYLVFTLPPRRGYEYFYLRFPAPEAPNLLGFAGLYRGGSKGVSPKWQNWFVFNPDVFAQGWFVE